MFAHNKRLQVPAVVVIAAFGERHRRPAARDADRLSFQLPFAVVPLVRFTGSAVMGSSASGHGVRLAGVASRS